MGIHLRPPVTLGFRLPQKGKKTKKSHRFPGLSRDVEADFIIAHILSCEEKKLKYFENCQVDRRTKKNKKIFVQFYYNSKCYECIS
ncbi:hypothetical protein CE91St46_04030 [Eubacteriales bacterium]|nr:hypothetical protein CE91St46_04030 [Eubacteriales bacterium]GKH61933.1 hypothetical protein CE91St47_04020 [Eubacteriales bacterium]